MTSSSIRKKKTKNQKHLLIPTLRFISGIGKVSANTVLAVSMLASAIISGGLVGLALSFRNLPDVRVLGDFVPSETSYIYDIKGRLLTSIHGEEHREITTLDQISPDLKRAVLAIEDSHFYIHEGINPYSIGRAALVNFREQAVVEGASTLTMQLVKNVFLSNERSVTRKLAEAILAIRIEQVFSKEEILEMYLNNIYWGHNNYGVETAAQSYFNKSASELNLAESAMMAGLIQAPERYSPFINYQETKRRQSRVLSRMATLGWITPQEAEQARLEPLLVGEPKAWQDSNSPYITDAVLKELRERFGEEVVSKGGISVQATIDSQLQEEAEQLVQEEHRRLHRIGVKADQVALVAVDPRTHFVKVLVGGVDYDSSQFNRGIQSLRQPGSAFKPFVYYAAFASGKFTPYSIVSDTRITYFDGFTNYTPRNYGGGFAGKVSIYDSLIKSRNIPAVKIGQSIGLDNVIEVTRKLGITSPLSPVISLPLGPNGVSPLELTGAYATFASNGWHSDLTTIVRVTDSEGNVILDNTPKPKLVLNEWATASLTSVLKGVIEAGTARNANIDRPAAGKTGTTSSERDVWFVGYVPQLATAVWIGNDDNRPLGRGVTGGSHAAPIWRKFMLNALENEPIQYFHDPNKFDRPQS